MLWTERCNKVTKFCDEHNLSETAGVSGLEVPLGLCRPIAMFSIATTASTFCYQRAGSYGVEAAKPTITAPCSYDPTPDVR